MDVDDRCPVSVFTSFVESDNEADTANVVPKSWTYPATGLAYGNMSRASTGDLPKFFQSYILHPRPDSRSATPALGLFSWSPTLAALSH